MPRGAKGRPRGAKGRPKGGQREAKGRPREAQGRPRGGQERPREARPGQDAKKEAATRFWVPKKAPILEALGCQNPGKVEKAIS